MPTPGDLPYLKAAIQAQTVPPTDLYDVKFYPYAEPGDQPVFAATGDRLTIVARPKDERPKDEKSSVPRPKDEQRNAIDVLRCWREESEDYQLNSVTWSQDIETGDPLLCVSGKDREIKVYNVTTGDLVRTLTGHGDLVNDLITSPLDPRIIASCSMDYTVRIWNLDPRAKNSPTPIVIAGSHRDGVISIDFHHNGQWLLSGGHDTVVSLWSLPPIDMENPETDHGTVIHYPHFTSTEIHSDYVDCIKWHNNLIISKCAQENIILLWRIDHFDPSAPAPAHPAVPANPASADSLANCTRSAWPAPGRFQRLLTFETPVCSLFYMRFGLFHALGQHPFLVMGNQKAKFYFWDLQRLEEGWRAGEYPIPGGPGRNGKGRAGRRKKKGAPAMEGDATKESSPAASLVAESVVSGSNVADGAGGAGSAVAVQVSTSEIVKDRGIGDPYKPIPAHVDISAPRYKFAVRGIAFSPRGEWMVGVGDGGVMCLFRRWDKEI